MLSSHKTNTHDKTSDVVHRAVVRERRPKSVPSLENYNTVTLQQTKKTTEPGPTSAVVTQPTPLPPPLRRPDGNLGPYSYNNMTASVHNATCTRYYRREITPIHPTPSKQPPRSYLSPLGFCTHSHPPPKTEIKNDEQQLCACVSVCSPLVRRSAVVWWHSPSAALRQPQ